MYIKPLPSSNTKLACILFDKYRLIWTILLNYCRWHQFIQPSKTNKVYPIGYNLWSDCMFNFCLN
jgi:hypothetical protein